MLIDEAKAEKLKEIKKLMREILADKGDVELSDDELGEVLDDASEEAELPEAEGEMIAEGVDESDDELDELSKLKKDYFQPKQKERRPGTAIVIAKSQTVKPTLSKAIPEQFNSKKKSKWV